MSITLLAEGPLSLGAPIALSAPTLTGVAVGDGVYFTPGTYSEPVELSYVLFREGQRIGDEHYVPTLADETRRFVLLETAVGARGIRQQLSRQVGTSAAITVITPLVVQTIEAGAEVRTAVVSRGTYSHPSGIIRQALIYTVAGEVVDGSHAVEGGDSVVVAELVETAAAVSRLYPVASFTVAAAVAPTIAAPTITLDSQDDLTATFAVDWKAPGGGTVETRTRTVSDGTTTVAMTGDGTVTFDKAAASRTVTATDSVSGPAGSNSAQGTATIPALAAAPALASPQTVSLEGGQTPATYDLAQHLTGGIAPLTWETVENDSAGKVTRSGSVLTITQDDYSATVQARVTDAAERSAEITVQITVSEAVVIVTITWDPQPSLDPLTEGDDLAAAVNDGEPSHTSGAPTIIATIINPEHETAVAGQAYTVRQVAEAPDGTLGSSPISDPVTAAALTVSIAGTPEAGETLTATPSAAGGAYQWQRDEEGIAGATASTYTLQEADGGAEVRVAYLRAGITAYSDPASVPVPNQPPVATDDTATVAEQETILIRVLGNDSDADGDTLTITAASAPQGSVDFETAPIDLTDWDGNTIPEGEDYLAYTAPGDFDGSVVVTYDISDGQGGTDQGSVTIDVQGAFPNAPDLTANVIEGNTVAILLTGVSDSEGGDGFEVTTLGGASAANASIETDADGSVTGTVGDTYLLFDATGLTGASTEGFTYTIRNVGGTLTSTGNVTVNVAAETVDPPEALATGAATVADANTSGNAISVTITTAPTSDAAIEEYALTTETVAVDEFSDLYPLGGTDTATAYTVDSADFAQDVEISLRLVSRSVAGWSPMSVDTYTVRPSKPLAASYTGSLLSVEADVDDTLTITPSGSGSYTIDASELETELYALTAVPLAVPQVFGTASVGSTLSAQVGIWAYRDGDDPPTGEWYRRNISTDAITATGTTDLSFTIVDDGYAYFWRETADGLNNDSAEIVVPAAGGVTITPTVDGFIVEGLPVIAAFDVITPTVDGFIAEQS